LTAFHGHVQRRFKNLVRTGSRSAAAWALVDPLEKSLFHGLDVVKGVIHGETPLPLVLR
jgi:hypothetical protein